MKSEHELAVLNKIKMDNCFLVPDNYFDQSKAQILSRIQIENYTNHKGFKVPEGYFEQLTERINAQIQLDTLIEHKEETGFKVDEKYFEQLNAKIIAKTQPLVNNSKTVRLWSKKWFKYASAASIALLITAAWATKHFVGKYKLAKEELAKEQLLYDIDDEVIADYIYEAKNKSAIQVKSSELEEYIINNMSSYEISRNIDL